MNPFGIGFLSWDNLGIIAIIVVVLIVFLKDFNMTSKRSWVVLLGLTVIGGLTVFQSWRRKQLLRELEQREKAVKDLKDAYEKAKSEGRISAEALTNSRSELEEMKRKYEEAVREATAHRAADRDRINATYRNMGPDDAIRRGMELRNHR